MASLLSSLILEVIAELYVSTFAVAFKLPDFWLHHLLHGLCTLKLSFLFFGCFSQRNEIPSCGGLTRSAEGHVMTFLRDPPHPREWHHSFATPSLLKSGLRNSSLSLWPGWWPLKLMESMLSLLGMDDGFIFTYIFLQQLLAPVQAGLANSLSLA